MYLKHHATPVLCSNVIAAVDCSSELSSCQHSDFITCHSANSAIYLPQIKHRLAHFTGTRTHKTQQQTFLPPNSHVFFQMFIVRRSLSIVIGKIIIINDWIMVSFQALQYFRLITIKEIMTFLYQTNLQTGKKYSGTNKLRSSPSLYEFSVCLSLPIVSLPSRIQTCELDVIHLHPANQM